MKDWDIYLWRTIKVVTFPLWFIALIAAYILFLLILAVGALPYYVYTGKDLFKEWGP